MLLREDRIGLSFLLLELAFLLDGMLGFLALFLVALVLATCAFSFVRHRVTPLEICR